MIKKLIDLAEKGILPDFLIRSGIKRMQKERLLWEKSRSISSVEEHHQNWVDEMKKSSIAYVPEKANEQHYEVPPAFFENALGKHLKYSCCYWDENTETLDEAEAKMLKLTCERAEIEDGHDILELGCGWGAISLWMAESYPNSRITSVSNSQDQRKFIMNHAKMRGLNNLEVKTCDMNSFEINQTFDRVISVEMFEHMKNYEELLSRVKHWLKPEGKLFVHIFSHINFAYHFETEGSSNWMGRHFFTGGIMPSHDLLSHFNRDLIIDNEWKVNGIHYHKTAEAWLQNMDKNKSHIRSIFSETYGKEHATKWWSYWRIFFMACSELWKTKNGDEWIVSHYLMKRK